MIGTIAAGIGIGGSLIGGKRGKDAAEDAASSNAALIREQTAEAIRRTELQFDQQTGSAIASTGGSGVRGDTGSTANYITAMETEQDKQLDWMAQAGQQKENIALESGQQAGDMAQLRGLTGAVAGFGGWATSNQGSEMMDKWGWV